MQNGKVPEAHMPHHACQWVALTGISGYALTT